MSRVSRNSHYTFWIKWPVLCLSAVMTHFNKYIGIHIHCEIKVQVLPNNNKISFKCWLWTENILIIINSGKMIYVFIEFCPKEKCLNMSVSLWWLTSSLVCTHVIFLTKHFSHNLLTYLVNTSKLNKYNIHYARQYRKTFEFEFWSCLF